jgi:hypothetical protein
MANVRRLGKTFRYVLTETSSADSLRIFLGSDIIHFNIFGSSVIVVNSAETARELFEKRSVIYSDRLVHIVYRNIILLTGQPRPRMPMLNEMYVISCLWITTSLMAAVSDLVGISALFLILKVGSSVGKCFIKSSTQRLSYTIDRLKLLQFVHY